MISGEAVRKLNWAFYKDFLTDAQIGEVKEYTSDVAESAVLKMTPEQMRAKALEGYFMRDAERNLVYCPQGEILRQKSISKSPLARMAVPI